MTENATFVVECKLRRTGGTRITMADGTAYHFTPRESGKHLALIPNEAHARRLVSEIPEAYRLDAKVAPDALDELRRPSAPAPAPAPAPIPAVTPPAPGPEPVATQTPAAPDAAQTSDVQPTAPENPQGEDDAMRAGLEAEYERLTGRAPHPAIKLETLKERVQEELAEAAAKKSAAATEADDTATEAETDTNDDSDE